VNILNINSQTYLTTTLFSNGEPISEAKTQAEWEQLSMNNQPVLMKKNIEGKEYFFYNWYAISDKRQLVDEKWMIPNQNEIVIWNAYSPIEIVPVGIISEQGAFTKVTDQNYFWTSSEYTDKGKRESAVSFSISTVNNNEIELKQAYKQEGFLVLVIEKEKMSNAIKEAAKLLGDAKRLSSTIINNTTKTETNSTNGNNPSNQASTSVKGNNTFGSGGSENGNGAGNGPSGFGDGKARTRLNDANLPSYDTDFDSRITLKLSINANGDVFAATCIKSKSTCTDQHIINQVIAEVMRQVKYKKDPGSGTVYAFYTVQIDAK
jgi:hypothetical protein